MQSVILAAFFCLVSAGASAQGLWPGVNYDPAVPTLKSVVGHEHGEAISTPDQVGRYLEALAKAAPDRARLVHYATSWEGRPLQYLVIGSPARIAKLDEVKRGLQTLASGAPEADRLVSELPVVVLLIHGVHGNEISSSDAALAEAYHLLAARNNADADITLRDALVIIDPMQNPDGRQRFVTSNLLGRAVEADPNPQSAEHDEPWPGGRVNHYLFDMNRDYFAMSQRETQGRIRTMLEWSPQVVVDLHEMGGNSSYYFAPPADPFNPLITEGQRKGFELFGRANAAEFDKRGFGYFVKEVFDAFYPGYGDSWPVFQGAIAMTYEQASARGLAFEREDGSVLTYKQGVTQHFTAAVTTAVTAAKNRDRLLREFLEYRRSAIALGQKGTREYLIPPGKDPARAGRLARLLAAQGITVKQAEEAFTAGTQQMPRGTYIVPLAQPSGRLLRNLLDPDIKMDEAFLKEQDRRRKARLSDQIYDVTAWSLPLMYDVDIVASDRVTSVRTRDVRGDEPGATTAVQAPPAGTLGFLMPWGSGAAATAAEAVREGIRLITTDEAFKHGGREYAIGTAFVRLAGNAEGTAAKLQQIAQKHGAELVPISDTWTESGVSLGSNQTAALTRAPRVLLAWDAPVSSLSAGWARYTLEQRFGLRVTAMRTATLQNYDMSGYDVLVLPSGTYTFSDDALRRLKDWVRNGGTLITLAEATRWATRDRVGLLSTDPLYRDGTPQKDAAEGQGSAGTGSGGGSGTAGGAGAKPDLAKPFDFDKAIQPEREQPENLAGSMLRVTLYPYHWLTAGLDGDIQVIAEGTRVFAPLKLDSGVNVGVYAPVEKLVASGHVWKEALPLLSSRAYLMHQPTGRGHVIGFAEDPNYRAYAEATQLLFINAVLLGGGH
jgi:hypothetical protein